MHKSILRFEKRLSLSNLFKFKLIECFENNNNNLFNKFNEKNILNNQIMKLYYVSRNGMIQLILFPKIDFSYRIIIFCNKGYDIYLTNHSRYS